MKIFSFFFLMALLPVKNIFAQPGAGIGKVIIVSSDSSGLIADATVSIMRLKDSVLTKAGLTNIEGVAELENIKEGSYYITVTHIGFRKSYSKAVTISTDNTTSVRIKLSPSAATALREVSVTAKKPLIERQFDRLVVNVENSIISAGSSAMEILERSPGIAVDQNDNISMKGKSGVHIMIDGKMTPLSGQDLANMLRGLPSSAIEKIELITNPSARYDASGTAGIINIRMRKDQRIGTNGNFTVGAGYGKYWRTNEGVSINHRDKKMNLFGNYNYSFIERYIVLDLQRKFFDENTGAITGGFNQVTYANQPINNHNGRIGIDFFPSKRTIIGFVLNGLANNQGRHYDIYSKALDNAGNVDSLFTTLNRSHEILKTYGLNLNGKHSFDSSGKDLTVDLDYAKFNTHMDPTLGITYYDPGGGIKGIPYSLVGLLIGKLNIYSIKADYEQSLSKTVKMETGLKSSYVKTDNNLVFRQVVNGNSTYDSSKSNHFIYDENINAAYVNFSKSARKVNMQAGLRVEQTNVKGNQVTTGQSFDSSYLQLFPSATIDFKLKNKDQLAISVSRRIDRPSYSQMNPFKYFVDPTSYRTGNPGLRPQLTYSYELSYTHKQTIASLSFSETKDNLLAVLIPEKIGSNIYSVETTRNLAKFYNIGLNITSAIKIVKWWNTQNNLDLYYNNYQGNLANTPLNNGGPGLSISSNSSLSFAKGWSGESTIFWRAGQRIGYAVYQPVFRAAAGIQKIIMKKKGTLRFNVTDIFHTDNPHIVSTFKIYSQDYTYHRNTRVATLTFTYRFGKNTIPRARTRTGGAEEEKGRAN